VCLSRRSTGSHARRVYSLCLRMLGDPIEAEDLRKKRFSSFPKIHTFRGESAFRVAAPAHCNVVLMEFRKKKKALSRHSMKSRESTTRQRAAMGDRRARIELTGVFDRVNLQTAIGTPEGYKRMFRAT